jgi:hypothetical protein
MADARYEVIDVRDVEHPKVLMIVDDEVDAREIAIELRRRGVPSPSAEPDTAQERRRHCRATRGRGPRPRRRLRSRADALRVCPEPERRAGSPSQLVRRLSATKMQKGCPAGSA